MADREFDRVGDEFMCQSKAEGGRRCSSAMARTQLRKSTKSNSSLTERLSLFNEAVNEYGHIITPMYIELPASVQEAFDALREVGNPLLVGGTVRDALRGADPKDFDIEVHHASMNDISAVMKARGYRVDEVGQAFGVLKVRARDEDLDVSIPRRDSLAGVGHRGFIIETDSDMGVTEAAARRDYTMNAIMYDPHLQVMIDPHNGYTDLKEGVLRHVSDAFGDDPLRPLRGVQFAARYNMVVHPDTAHLSASLRGRYNELAQERVRDEWMKFYKKGEFPSAGLRALEVCGWSDTVSGYENINREAVNRVARESLELKAAVMTRNMSDTDARAFLKETIVGDKHVSSAYALSRATAPEETSVKAVRQWSRALGRKGVTVSDWANRESAHNTSPEPYLSVARRNGIAESAPVDLFTGDDIIASALKRRPGRWVGQLLTNAQEAQDSDVFTTREDALQWIRHHASES